MSQTRRVLVFGATGTIGRATVRALVRRGHRVSAFVRPRPADSGQKPSLAELDLPLECDLRVGSTESTAAITRDAFCGDSFDAVISCMASRSGEPEDAWAVDHRANLDALEASKSAGVNHFVLLSAICVQRPRLEFQKAKLAFEDELRESGLDWSIVRPTAFFKSISGQAERVKAGKPFLIFGDGRINACKPIGNGDLGDFLVDCVEQPELRDRVLPIGGPGPAVTPRDQGELLFRVVGREPRFRSVPVGFMRTAVGLLSAFGRLLPPLRSTAELARIGYYYATESMLVWDDQAGRYDADATPEYGTETLEQYYTKLVRGEVADERGEHAIL